jgi:CheY-like chemotaxis protein
MTGNPVRILLADDDIDDCLLFEDALAELSISAFLSTVTDGEQLIKRLFAAVTLPQVLFLDLNMPRKNGFECLNEIVKSEKTRFLPVIIISTSFDPDIVRILHSKGARYYIRKPEQFEALKWAISKGLSLALHGPEKTSFSNFLLNP